MRKAVVLTLLLSCITPWRVTHCAEQAMQDLRTIITQTTPLSDDAEQKEQLYFNTIRIALDPAYLDLPVAERKNIDQINEQFKKLHVELGNKLIPILPQENIEKLKFIAAEAIKTINSAQIKKVGGEIFKKRVQFIISSLMSIKANQTAKENEIKFQWIKPLYLDNQFLTTDLKKKMFEIFNNENYSRWLSGTKKMMLKVAPANGILIDEPVTSEPTESTPSQQPEQSIQPVTTESSTETLTLSDSAQQRLNQRKLPAIPNTPPATLPAKTPQNTPVAQPIAQPVAPAVMPAAEKAANISTDIRNIGQTLIQQALVAPAATIQTTIAKVPANQKFTLLQVTDDAQYAATHAAASLARADVLSILLKDLTPEQKFEIITMREKDGQTPVHLAASAKAAPAKGFKPAVAVEELLKDLTPLQKKEVIGMQDNDGATAIDIAQGINKSVADTLKRMM